jgi:uncharacterized repeat protein (TIGR03943 family)
MTQPPAQPPTWPQPPTPPHGWAQRPGAWPPAPWSGAPVGGQRIEAGRLIAGIVLSCLGLSIGQAVLSGSYLSFVRPVMRLPLGLAGVVLLVVGVVGAFTSVQPAAPGGDGHGGGRLAPLLLAIVPVVVLAVVRPPALDAAAASNIPPAAMAAPADSGTTVEPLPGPADRPVPITFDELATRVYATNGPDTLRGRTLLLTGFVAKAQGDVPGGRVRIGRYMIWCCAADATFSDAYVRWPAGAAAPEAGSWFTVRAAVDGILVDQGQRHVLLTAEQVTAIAQPRQPYEYSA